MPSHIFDLYGHGKLTLSKSNGWVLRDVTSFFCILWSVPVDQSGGLTLFDMGGMMVPQNVFDHCAQMLRSRKPKLGGF